MKEYYNQMLKFEQIQLQKFNNGIHTPRYKSDSYEEVERLKCRGFNHRKLGINEVVWDIDCNVQELANILWQKISIKLENDNITHFVFDTSRSKHIHALFEKLETFCQEDRKRIKLGIIRYYAQDDSKWCDKNMANENMNIRDFDGLHEITGKPKKLIWKSQNANGLVNALNPQILKIFEKRYKTLDGIEKIENMPNNAITNSNLNPLEQEQMVKFVDFCLAHRFDVTGMYKNPLLFKNIGIAIYILGYTNKQIEEVSKQIGSNCRGHHNGEILNWVKWCNQQRHELRVNWNEVKQFYKNER